tara:strand:- start:4155 stop:5618 length:1464 start_codon:yes stop_codon:yes gene_type:complete
MSWGLIAAEAFKGVATGAASFAAQEDARIDKAQEDAEERIEKAMDYARDHKKEYKANKKVAVESIGALAETLSSAGVSSRKAKAMAANIYRDNPTKTAVSRYIGKIDAMLKEGHTVDELIGGIKIDLDPNTPLVLDDLAAAAMPASQQQRGLPSFLPEQPKFKGNPLLKGLYKDGVPDSLRTQREEGIKEAEKLGLMTKPVTQTVPTMTGQMNIVTPVSSDTFAQEHAKLIRRADNATDPAKKAEYTRRAEIALDRHAELKRKGQAPKDGSLSKDFYSLSVAYSNAPDSERPAIKEEMNYTLTRMAEVAEAKRKGDGEQGAKFTPEYARSLNKDLTKNSPARKDYRRTVVGTASNTEGRLNGPMVLVKEAFYSTWKAVGGPEANLAERQAVDALKGQSGLGSDQMAGIEMARKGASNLNVFVSLMRNSGLANLNEDIANAKALKGEAIKASRLYKDIAERVNVGFFVPKTDSNYANIVMKVYLDIIK